MDNFLWFFVVFQLSSLLVSELVQLEAFDRVEQNKGDASKSLRRFIFKQAPVLSEASSHHQVEGCSSRSANLREGLDLLSTFRMAKRRQKLRCNKEGRKEGRDEIVHLFFTPLLSSHITLPIPPPGKAPPGSMKSIKITRSPSPVRAFLYVA